MRNVSRYGDWPEHVLAGLVIVAIACVARAANAGCTLA